MFRLVGEVCLVVREMFFVVYIVLINIDLYREKMMVFLGFF